MSAGVLVAASIAFGATAVPAERSALLDLYRDEVVQRRFGTWPCAVPGAPALFQTVDRRIAAIRAILVRRLGARAVTGAEADATIRFDETVRSVSPGGCLIGNAEQDRRSLQALTQRHEQGLAPLEARLGLSRERD